DGGVGGGGGFADPVAYVTAHPDDLDALGHPDLEHAAEHGGLDDHGVRLQDRLAQVEPGGAEDRGDGQLRGDHPAAGAVLLLEQGGDVRLLEAQGLPVGRPQAGGERRQVAQGAGPVGGFDPLFELDDGETAVGERVTQDLDDALTVGVGGAQFVRRRAARRSASGPAYLVPLFDETVTDLRQAG